MSASQWKEKQDLEALTVSPAIVTIGLFAQDPGEGDINGVPNSPESTTIVSATTRQTLALGSVVNDPQNKLSYRQNTTVVDFGLCVSSFTLGWIGIFNAVTGGEMLFSFKLTTAVPYAVNDPINFGIGRIRIRLQ